MITMKNIATAPVTTACVILAAGKGTRMKSALPKVLHCLAGRSMVEHVVATAQEALEPERMVLVTAAGMAESFSFLQKIEENLALAEQNQQLGTGDAVRAALPALADFSGIVFVLYGDTPLIQPATLVQMQAAMAAQNAAIGVLGMRPCDPAAYGRLILNETGGLERIVEFKDASPAEQAVDLCNSGVMAIRAEHLGKWLQALTNHNAKNEYYLTDIVALARAENQHCVVVEAPEEELLGVNDRSQLAEAEALMQQRLRAEAMAQGVTLQDPATVYFSYDTKIGQDVVIEPNVFFGVGVKIGSNVTIRAFSHCEQTHIGNHASIGPFARLRPGAEIGEHARIGNFVEIKQSTLEAGAKVNHLSYIGDAHIGVHANIGAGTITCNYDGFQKHHTRVGSHAFIGSNTALVAPIEIGANAIVGAGSVITEDVEADSLSMTRPTQLHRQGWAKQFRLRKRN
jgi:bifunctional UDP-N-acetylglucosamine pyrophosphorylase/glucosamine-1-phosphate N-acetyltransferase